MLRTDEIDREALPKQTSQILDALPDLGLFRLLAHSPKTMPAWLGFGGALLNYLALSPQTRELAILQVAASTRCKYEEVQHVVIAEGVGVPTNQIQAVINQDLNADCLALHAGMLHSIDKLVRTRTIDDTEFSALRGSLDDQQVVELLLVVGWYSSIALLVQAVDLPTDPSADMAVIEASDTSSAIRGEQS